MLCFHDHPPRDAAPAPRAAAPTRDAAPGSNSVNPRRPGREVCERYMQTGECPFEDKCFFDHPPRDHLPRTGDAGGGASAGSAAGVGEAPPVSNYNHLRRLGEISLILFLILLMHSL